MASLSAMLIAFAVVLVLALIAALALALGFATAGLLVPGCLPWLATLALAMEILELLITIFIHLLLFLQLLSWWACSSFRLICRSLFVIDSVSTFLNALPPPMAPSRTPAAHRPPAAECARPGQVQYERYECNIVHWQ